MSSEAYRTALDAVLEDMRTRRARIDAAKHEPSWYERWLCRMDRHDPVDVMTGPDRGGLLTITRSECSRRGCNAYWLRDELSHGRVRM